MVAIMADRQKSSTKMPGSVKKSTSTPSVRTLSESENGDISPADKKRNKLGYHRTAVACGHCRRRKIRCIPAADPNATRCQNCIRLKKDCQFYPVDQSAATQPKRNRSESKGDGLTAGSETSVSSSSPRMPAGPPIMDHYDQFRGSIDTTVMPHGPDQEYPHQYDQRYWHSTEPSQHPYWLQHDSNHSNSYTPSPYPMTPTTAGQSMTSQEHAFTFPATSLEHPNYHYAVQRSRDGPLPTHPAPLASFGGFRANTMPDRITAPDQPQRNYDLHHAPVSVPSQHLIGPPYQPVLGSGPSYSPAATHPIWSPSVSEPQHHQGNFVPPGPPPTWYNHADGLREDNSSHVRNRDAVNHESSHFRPKPG